MGAVDHARGQTSKLIVIIDNDQSMQDSLRNFFESTGLVERCFGSAEEFLEYGLHREVGCLIAEIQMPGMSGLELQARLKEEQCNVPVIFIPRNGAARMRIQAMREGAVEFLATPLDYNCCSKRSEQRLICERHGQQSDRMGEVSSASVCNRHGPRGGQT
jgi:FixJ family two-component response regulator